MCFVRSRQAEQPHLCAKMLLFLHPRNRYTTDKSSIHLPQMRAAVWIGKGEFHMARVYNFSAGPSMLPEKVLRQAQAELLEYGDSGQSVMEMSHRSKWFDAIITETEATLRRVMNIPDNYKVGFFQGGATQQFAMVPLNFMTTGKADYLVTGNFSNLAAKEAAKSKADDMLASFRSGSELGALAEAQDATYNENDRASYSAGSALSEWLFDDARKDGDTEILEVGTNYYVGLFHSRGREEYKTVDIRHILITPETGTKAQGDEGYEDEQTQLKAAARTKAEEILAQWKSGEATEDSFAQLAMENSADGSKYDGGLYTRVTKGWAVEEFNDWCFDASRKDGDTGIVDTTYGSHVMYFVGYDLPAWAASVTSDLQEKASSEWSTALSENADVQQSDFGMKFVG